MALIKCPHCGKETNNKRSKCILCGGETTENQRFKEEKLVKEPINIVEEMNAQKIDSEEIKEILSEKYSGLKDWRFFLRTISILASIGILLLAWYDFENTTAIEYFLYSNSILERDLDTDEIIITYSVILVLTLWSYNSLIKMIDFLFDLAKRNNCSAK